MSNKKTNRTRDRKISVWLLDEELAILQAKADEAEMTQSEFLRNCIVFGSAKERTYADKEDTEKLIYELNRIGNNVNQIAYQANQRKYVSDEQFQSLYSAFLDLLGQFDNFVRK